MRSDNDLLLSELRSGKVPAEHLQEFCIRNAGTRSVECAIESPSCGCLGFEKDSFELPAGTSWTLAAGKQCVIGARFPLSLRTGRVDRSFSFVEGAVGRQSLSRRLVWYVAVHDDLLVDPPTVRCTHRGGQVESPPSVSITVCTRAQGPEVAPFLEFPEGCFFRVGELVPESEWEHLGGGLRRGRFRATLGFDRARLGKMFTSGSDAIEVKARVVLATKLADASLAPTADVLLSIDDASQLSAPKLVDFGTIRSGATAKRSLLVSTRDSGDFSVGEFRVEGLGEVRASAPPGRVGRFQMVALSFSAPEPGEYRGKLTLVPASGAYQPASIDYRATVSNVP